MDANTLSRIGLLTALLASPAAMANDNIVVLQLGQAFSNEKLDIKIADAKFHHMFWRWGDSGCQFGLGYVSGRSRSKMKRPPDWGRCPYRMPMG